MLVLEAGLDQFFNHPAMQESPEVAMVFPSLGDLSKNGKASRYEHTIMMMLAMTSFGWWGHVTEKSSPAAAVKSWTQCY
jgi:hypothetical protein